VGHFCVNCGAALVPRTIEGREVEACPNDEFVLWRDPKVATAVVVAADGGVVLGRRAIEPGYGLWCLPGGFVNHDEDPADAAVRECLEEIGVRVQLTGLLCVYHIAKTEAASMIGIAYRGRLAAGVAPTAGAEMLEVAIFAAGALPPLAFPSHESVLAEYLRSPGPAAAGGLPNGLEAARRGKPPSPAQGRRMQRHTP
jgi:ADP-ribose pyrophosphatase YjhB (NUDIX family)